MAANGHFASGDWIVSGGREQEFVARWTEFLEWARQGVPGLGSAHLIHDSDNPNHFISFASWESREAMDGWRARPEFATRLGACRELCDDFRGSSYTLAAAVGEPA
jgi:heme-degrading monooxygenase HmoA